MSETRIITDYVHPPVPIRHMDWVAYRDGNEETGPCGRGRTEAEAIEDLLLWEEGENV